jgi:hypothetical protein
MIYVVPDDGNAEMETSDDANPYFDEMKPVYIQSETPETIQQALREGCNTSLTQSQGKSR